MSTPHNSANIEDIAKTVIMPGDPLRCKFIAENFLEDIRLVNNVRGMLAYTGTYQGKPITVMAHGMGNGSAGIYTYELFKFYNVDKIIRIGSIGALSEDIKLKDIIIAEKTYTNTNYYDFYTRNGNKAGYVYASEDLVKQAVDTAKTMGVNAHIGAICCSDTFYTDIDQIALAREHNLLGVEMESASIYINANLTNKKALCIATVSDSIVTGESLNSEERQLGFSKMIKLALEMI